MRLLTNCQSLYHLAKPGAANMTIRSRRDGETAEAVAEQLRGEIIRGLLAPGTPLRQEALAQRFQISRMPIRDGLKILEREGLVLLPVNRSARVSPLDPDSLREINEMRAVAEPLALKHAIPEISDRQIGVAAAIQSEAEEAGIDDFPRLNSAFHAALFTPCGRPRLLAHIATLNDLSERYFHIAAVEMDYADRSHEEHCDLLEACRKRDTDAACRMLERHITRASELMLQALEASEGSTARSE
jgi:DNA-binding GntR family transcriptional regulator